MEEVQAGFGRDLPLDLLHLGGRLVVLVVRGLLLLRQCSGSRLVRIHAAGVWRCVTHKRGEERAGHRRWEERYHLRRNAQAASRTRPRPEPRQPTLALARSPCA